MDLKIILKSINKLPTTKDKIVEDIIKSGRIQKDDLTIVVVDGL